MYLVYFHRLSMPCLFICFLESWSHQRECKQDCNLYTKHINIYTHTHTHTKGKDCVTPHTHTENRYPETMRHADVPTAPRPAPSISVLCSMGSKLAIYLFVKEAGCSQYAHIEARRKGGKGPIAAALHIRNIAQLTVAPQAICGNPFFVVV